MGFSATRFLGSLLTSPILVVKEDGEVLTCGILGAFGLSNIS